MSIRSTATAYPQVPENPKTFAREGRQNSWIFDGKFRNIQELRVCGSRVTGGWFLRVPGEWKADSTSTGSSGEGQDSSTEVTRWAVYIATKSYHAARACNVRSSSASEKISFQDGCFWTK